MKQEISDFLANSIKEKYNLENLEIKLDIPPKKELWDFAFGVFTIVKELKKNPNIIALEMKDFLLEKNPDLLESVDIAWPYLNIKVNKNFFTKKFLDFVETKNLLSLQEDNKTKTIYVDYVWVNVWKPLHIGHICPALQWQFIVNLSKKLWYKVIWDSHIWDWGIIFGKLITAYKLWWNEEKLKENAVEHLFNLYVKATSEAEKDKTLEQEFRNEFKLLSEWKPESIKLWESFTKESIKAMRIQLERLKISYDYDLWESFYEGINLPKMQNYPDLKYSMKDVVKELVEKWIATKNEDGSVGVIFSEETKIPSCILQKRDWTHWYLASDLAAVRYRVENWNPDRIFYAVDVRQQLHLKQVCEISKMANWLWKSEFVHSFYWFISLKDWAMSTRKWKIIKLDDLLDEAETRAKNIILEKRDDITWEELDSISKIVWIWAIKYWYLKKNRESDIIFDWDEFMSFEGNSGPYIQYSVVRAKKILENFKNVEMFGKNISEISYFSEKEELELAKDLMNYEEILLETSKECYPHILANYIYNITKKFNSFYNACHILNEENQEKKSLRIMLTKTFIEICTDAMRILWIEIPERM